MESGRRSGQESGRTLLRADHGDWVERLPGEPHPGGKPWQDDVLAASGSRQTPKGSARVKRPADARPRRQFAEAFYLMVMASDLRERARALGRRYGLEATEIRAEILRYIDDLSSGGTEPGS
jgi:hypothetical protein